MSTPNTPTPIPPLRWRKSSRSANNGSCVEVADVTDPRQLDWLKSSRSSNNGACVEIAAIADPGQLDWLKSSRSGNNGTCVEVASTGHAIAVRDSKDPDGAVLVFCADEWSAFLDGVRTGGFDPA